MSSKNHLRRLREEDVPDRGVEGLRDGGHTYLSCSNCNAILMDIFRTRPHEPDVWKVRCSCPWCGDKSFITEIKGGFHRGGYGLPKEDDENDVWASTDMAEEEIIDDVIFFHMKKASDDAKPVYRR